MKRIHDRIYDSNSATGFIFREPRPPEVLNVLRICRNCTEKWQQTPKPKISA